MALTDDETSPVDPSLASRRGTRLVSVETVRRGSPISFGGRIGWTRVRLACDPPLARPLRLLHVSDLHLRHRVPVGVETIADEIAADPPDVVLITGDLVDDKFDHAAAIPLVQGLIPRLRGRLGTFGILGNHDGDLLAGHLERLGVVSVADRVLDVVEAGRPVLRLVGLPGVDRDDPTEVYEFEPDRADAPLVALSHFPDVIRRLGRLRPDVVLAGHTHGGQICLPGGWAPLTHDSLPRRMCRGVHETAVGVLVVTRGMGATQLPVRLFAPAEVVELRLENAS